MLIDRVMEITHAWASTPRGTLPEDPVELVQAGYSDPMRVFVKNEPHGREKLESGRVRLIIMVPFHIVLAEMLLHGNQNRAEIGQWETCPSKPGIGLTEDAHIKTFFQSVEPLLCKGELVETDISGFDFCQTELMHLLDARRRVELAIGANEEYENAVYNNAHVMCRSVFALSDGRMFKQLIPGIMKSGRYVTSSTNSFIRVLLAHSIGSTFCVAMGDDALERKVGEAAKKYEKLGLRIKFIRQCEGSFNFCSHDFVDGVAYPSNPGKMLYNLLHQNGTPEQKLEFFWQWAFEMRHHPDYELFVDSFIVRSGWSAQNDGKQQNEEARKEINESL